MEIGHSVEGRSTYVERTQGTVLRPDVRGKAVDTVLVVTSPQSHEMLDVDGCHSLDCYERGVARTPVFELFLEATEPTGPR